MSLSYDHGGNVFAVARTLGVAPDQVVDFSASINPCGMSPMVRRALTESIDSLVHYPDTGHGELKRSLARHHNLSPENFTVANGSTELIYLLPLTLPGKRALIVAPSFSEYVRALRQHRWETEYFLLSPENNFSLDTEKLAQALERGFDALFICNPGNPGGTLYPPKVMEEVSALCRSAGTFMVLDEAFMDFCEEASARHSILHNDNAVVLRSMTKFFAIPGLRLGYAIGSPAVVGQLASMGGPWNVNTMALAAGAAALGDVRHNQASLEFIRQERQILHDGLAQFLLLKVYPSAANYLLAEIRGGMTSGELKKRLLADRILIRDCAGFAGLSDRFFRVAVRTAAENKQLLDCLGRILI